MLMRAPSPPETRSPLRRAVDWCDDWRQSAGIGGALFLILAGVSAYYLVRWGHANAMPGLIAWALPAALDLTGYRAVIVAKRADNEDDRRSAMTLVWWSVALSMLGNIGSHAIDAQMLQPSFWTMAATVSVIPLMAIWGHIVGGKIGKRPEVTATADELDRLRRDLIDTRRALAAITERAQTAERERDELAARRRPRPIASSSPAPETVPPPAGRHRPPPYTAAQLTAATEFLVLEPDRGRRAMVTGIGGGVGDSAAKVLHAAARSAAAALPEHERAAIRARAKAAAGAG